MHRLTRAFACAALLTAATAVADDSLTFGISQPCGAEAAQKVPALVEPSLSKALKVPVKVVRFAPVLPERSG